MEQLIRVGLGQPEQLVLCNHGFTAGYNDKINAQFFSFAADPVHHFIV